MRMNHAIRCDLCTGDLPTYAHMYLGGWYLSPTLGRAAGVRGFRTTTSSWPPRPRAVPSFLPSLRFLRPRLFALSPFPLFSIDTILSNMYNDNYVHTSTYTHTYILLKSYECSSVSAPRIFGGPRTMSPSPKAYVRSSPLLIM